MVSVIPDAIFLALMSIPNSKGYIWNEYVEAMMKYNTDQIYRQATIDLQQQKELDITNIETEEDLVVVYGDPALLYEIKEAVETIEGATVESFEKTRIPDEYIELTDEEDIVKFDRLLTLLEDIDDVQEFYHNVDR